MGGPRSNIGNKTKSNKAGAWASSWITRPACVILTVDSSALLAFPEVEVLWLAHWDFCETTAA
jgi:hypothetical protein